MPDSGAASSTSLLPDLPEIAPDEVALRRQLFRRCGPLQLVGHALGISCCGEALDIGDAGNAFDVSVGPYSACLRVPDALIAQLAHAVDPVLCLDAADDAIAGMLVELLFAGELSALESALRHEVTLRRRRAETVPDGLPLWIRCVWDGEAHHVVLRLGRELARMLCPLLELLPAQETALPDLPVTLEVRLGSAILAVGEIDDLEAGDVIMPHTPPLIAGKAEIVLAERWVAAADLAGRSVTLTAALKDSKEQAMENDTSVSPPGTANIEDGTLDELPVKLNFEIGRCEIALSELRTIGVGHVFELGRDPEQSVDIVVAGRRIGWGQLVRIGDRLGVRVLRLGRDG
jgi:type III secretion protein Q